MGVNSWRSMRRGQLRGRGLLFELKIIRPRYRRVLDLTNDLLKSKKLQIILNPTPFFYSYLNALIGLLLATRFVLPATVNHAMARAIKPETRHMGIMNKGLNL